MPQPSDPLLAFNAEPGVAESPVTPVDSPAVDGALPSNGVQERIDQFERSLNRALTEIAALKSDQATLVAALDDLKKRQSRRPDPPPAVVPEARRPRRMVRRAVVTIVLVMILGAATFATMLLLEDGAPPDPIAPVAAIAPEPVAAISAPVPPPALELITVAAQETPRRRVEPEPERSSATPTGYVGTLSIDASPGGRVFINRQSIGDTPARAEKLRAGSHLVWIERDGYRRWTRVVTVSANRVSRVFADLEPLADRR